jgi:flavin-dependent dehydrogenase
MKRHVEEHLVIGGGPAGSMAAIRLAEAGRRVTLLEREREAHAKVCGEFLSVEAVEYLDRVGIDLRALGAVPIERVRLCNGVSIAETALPFRAYSLSRMVLDEAMIVRAAAKGCTVRRGIIAEGLIMEADGWRVEIRGEEPLRARAVFLATGKHDVHGWARGAGQQPDLIGFKLHWRLQPEQTGALRGGMELFLFRDGYGGLSLVEGDMANLCLVVRRRRLQAYGGWDGLLEEFRRGNRLLEERLQGAQAVWERPLAIAPIPYGYAAVENRGVWRIGDQAAVIPSFTGDGMSIAMHSATLAAQMCIEGKSSAAYHRALRGQLRSGMRLATLLSRAMVTPVGRGLAAWMMPRALEWIAATTRVPEQAIAVSRDAGTLRPLHPV